ncbi:MAG: nitric oxide reductase activation protein NorD [Gammaproteobacteria bacterium]
MAAPQAARYLGPYLRALWASPVSIGALPEPAPRAVLGDALLRLPAGALGSRDLALATAAHAGAHRAHGGPPFDRGALKPVQLALVGLLEDARVEWLAARELPGLRALWLAFHAAGPESGNGFEMLLQRLARSLLDPGYRDPHPWVQKGRRLFFGDAEGRALAVGAPQALRRAASLLGNDIGQMRLQFNAKLYRIEPAYRDDNSHLWIDEPEAVDASLPPEGVPDADATASARASEQVSVEASVAYPEWDRLIARYRPRWARVFERLPERPGSPEAIRRLEAALRGRAAVSRVLADRLESLQRARRGERPVRAADGEDFHPGALVDARVAQRMRSTPDPRVYLRRGPGRDPAAFAILLDASASTARPSKPDAVAIGEGAGAGRVATVLDAARLAALLAAEAVERTGSSCALMAFASNGRGEVEVLALKGFDERAGDPAVLARAAGLRSRWSTRLGAALRHATAALARRPERFRHLLVLTDGEPHDVDVHDARYLVEDLRMALREAARADVAVSCLDIAAASSGPLRPGPLSMRNAFAPGAWRAVRSLDALPAAFAAAIGQAGR